MNRPSRHSRSQPDPEPTVEHPNHSADAASGLIPQFGAGEPVAGGEAELSADVWRPSESVEPVAPKDHVDPQEVSWAGAPIEPADEDLDLLAESNRRPGRLTITLVAAILATVAFGGGVLVQKHYGGTTTAAGGLGAAGAGGALNRNFPGAYGNFGGAGAGAGGAGAAGGAQTGGAAAADTPSVVGTVVKVSGTTVTVKNFAGKLITVKVPAGTTISLSSTLTLTGLKAGTSVAVVGTAAADGSVTASAVTARK
jgi:hypothetical protein